MTCVVNQGVSGPTTDFLTVSLGTFSFAVGMPFVHTNGIQCISITREDNEACFLVPLNYLYIGLV